MKPYLIYAIAFAVGATAQVGTDGITTVPYPPSCTATGQNTYAVTDTAGSSYVFMCGAIPGGLGTTITSGGNPDWRACFSLCDNYAGPSAPCNAFAYNQEVSGGSLGTTVGNCILRTGGNLPGTQTFKGTTALTASFVGAIMRQYSGQ